MNRAIQLTKRQLGQLRRARARARGDVARGHVARNPWLERDLPLEGRGGNKGMRQRNLNLER